ncbi:acyl carrier protein [Fructilactobacillus cliffordii]|uniref:Acyl carrier protein n=1 Tax=Fructilactobacillus cliffordii TaxID=2940299 RepID=A0A9Q8ZY59_9LACO|nr:acyl carrier protein [Fructilactobacillus cliffordii]USS86690.1 acyl carrier protein [Fructilactobacillus cliffordii]USS89686.1 acyl carrier protein [Fructilactobacillus cliffordii]
MDEQTVFATVAQTLEDQFQVEKDEINLETNFQRDLGADFVDLAHFIVELEDEFGDVIPDDAAEQIDTVQDLVTVIVKNTPKQK